MSKPEKTEAQKLLGVLGIKIEELQSEINQIESKKACPFWYDFSSEATEAVVDNCVYMRSNNRCENLAECPSNSDAWCYNQITIGIKKEKKSEIIDDLKKILNRYVELRCDNCEMCET
jgi:hypothetical protein